MADSRSDALLAALTLEEKVRLLAGRDLWNTPAVERLGIPSLRVTDGPNGARGGDMSGGVTAACFPVATALAATWDVERVEEVGRALGDETLSKGAHLLLAPTVNIQRNPLAGRNFECYSEDPRLSGRLATAFVRGVQSRGVGCSVKHFVCNDSEFERHTISAEVDERTLREVYLLPFEMVVREARPWSVMAAYNRLNGTHCSEEPRLLTEILRDEWGFDGFVVSDWFGTRSTGPALAAGLDLEMPGPTRFRGEKLLEAVETGAVEPAAVDRAARRMLAALERAGRFESPEDVTERAEDRPEHRRLARRAAADGIVLLKNAAATLPLDAGSLRRLAVIGPNAGVAVVHGGGSSRVTPHYEVSPLEGIEARCGPQVEVVHAPGCTNHKTLPPLDAGVARSGGEPGVRVEFFQSPDPQGEPVLVRRARRVDFTWLGRFSDAVDPTDFSVRVTADLVPREDGVHTLGLTSAGRSRLRVDGEPVVDNWEHQERGEAFYGVGSTEVTGEVALEAGRAHRLEVEWTRAGAPILAGLRVGWLPPLGGDALERAVACARGADAAVVVVGLNPDWETEGRDRESLELPGRQAELVERVAEANPRTVVVLNCGSPVACDWIDRVPAALVLWYPGQECGNALADVLFGDVNPSGRLPQSWPRRLEDAPTHEPGRDGRVHYREGRRVGYRGYRERGVLPRFAFGHGLSYTRFRYGDLRLEGWPPVAEVDVTNTGDRPGAEVVRLFFDEPDVGPRLCGFTKLRLEPGETRTARIVLDERDLSFWDEEAARWTLYPADESRVAVSLDSL